MGFLQWEPVDGNPLIGRDQDKCLLSTYLEVVDIDLDYMPIIYGLYGDNFWDDIWSRKDDTTFYLRHADGVDAAWLG